MHLFRLGHRVELGLVTLTLALTSIQGCSLTTPPSELDRSARDALEAVAKGDSIGFRRIADTSLLDPAASDDYRTLALTLSAWAPESTALIGWNINYTGAGRAAQLTYELHGHQGWGLALLTFVGDARSYHLSGLRLMPEAGSMASMNGFSLRGHGPAHYLMLAATLATVLFSLASAMLVWRTPMPRRRRFAALALVSFGAVALNWTTGEWGVQPVRLLLFGGAADRSGMVGPWILSCGLPLGACIALWRRAEHRREAAET